MEGLAPEASEDSEVTADPLGWGLGCVERCGDKCLDCSSEGTPAGKRARAEVLNQRFGPKLGPLPKKGSFKFGACDKEVPPPPLPFTGPA